MSATTALHSAAGSPNLPAAPEAPPPFCPGRIYSPLPNMWVGLSLAFLCLAFEVPTQYLFAHSLPISGSGEVDPAQVGYILLRSAVMLVSAIGSCYWLFCIHRIHKVLAEYTCHSYPISPAKAAWFQTIPGFNYYWSFRWTRQLATFANREFAAANLPKTWPGLLLVASSILGWIPEFKSLRLFLVFGLGLYFTRSLREVLPPHQPIRFKRLHQWKLATSAGAGAVFSFVLFRGVSGFFSEGRSAALAKLGVIVVVSVGVLIFLEPSFEKLRVMLGIAEHHHRVPQAPKPRYLRIAAISILVITLFFHGLLDAEISETMALDSLHRIQAFAMLAAVLLVTGGITFFWVGAAHRRPPHAARSGFLSGGLLGYLLVLTVLTILIAFPVSAEKAKSGDRLSETAAQKVGDFVRPLANAEQSPAIDRMAKRVVSGAEAQFPFFPEALLDDITGSAQSGDHAMSIAIVAFPWPLFGLIGGLAIDRRWAQGKAWAVALCVVSVALLYEILLWRLGKMSSGKEMLPHLSAAIGWGLSLVVCSSSQVLSSEEIADAARTGAAA